MKLSALARPALRGAALVALAGSGAAFQLLPTSAPAPLAGPRCLGPEGPYPVVDVRVDFGAAGDGVTDDTAALRAAAAYVSQNPGTTLYFPPGRYHVGRYAVDWWPSDALPDQGFGAKTALLFLNATDFRVVGCEATIDVLGAYTKTPGPLVWEPDGPHFARETSYLPFVFLGCSNFEVRGFELDGNTDQLEVTPGYSWAEQFEAGLLTADCSDYAIRDVESHHFPSDGMILGTGVIDERVLVERVHCHHVARAALGLIQVREATIQDSTFEHAGDTDGPWPGLSPAVGVGIEADCSTDPNDLNYCAGFPGDDDILLQRLRVLDNQGSGVSFAHGKTTDRVTLRDSVIRVPDESTAFPLFLGARTTVVENCDIFAERGPIVFASDAPDPTQVSVHFDGNRITGHGLLLYGGMPYGELWIRDNVIDADFVAPLDDLDVSFILLTGDVTQDWRLLGNTLYVPAIAAPFDGRTFIGVGGFAVSAGNRWEVTGGLPATTFAISYAAVLAAVDWALPAAAFTGVDDLTGEIGRDGSIVLP